MLLTKFAISIHTDSGCIDGECGQGLLSLVENRRALDTLEEWMKRYGNNYLVIKINQAMSCDPDEKRGYAYVHDSKLEGKNEGCTGWYNTNNAFFDFEIVGMDKIVTFRSKTA